MIVWDAATGELVTMARGFDVYLRPAFSPDGSRIIAVGITLAAGRSDEAVCLWNVPAAGK